MLLFQFAEPPHTAALSYIAIGLGRVYRERVCAGPEGDLVASLRIQQSIRDIVMPGPRV